MPRRAFTGSALKPQGLSPDGLAVLAERFARGGLDFIKDDHGLADQDYSRFADRVPPAPPAVARGAQATGHPTRYIPSLTGNLDQMRQQAALARDEGLDCVMVAPMIAGFSNVQAVVPSFPDMALFAHPSMGGAADRARTADWQAVPPDRLRRGDLPQPRRPVRLSPKRSARHWPQTRAGPPTADSPPCRSRPAA